MFRSKCHSYHCPKESKPKKVNIVQDVRFMKIPWVEIVFDYVVGDLIIVDARRKN
jgi:hypothetical protein